MVGLKPPFMGSRRPREKIVRSLVKIDYFTDGWCGPYYSDNKFQSSVKQGSHKPKTELGRCCKRHDNQLASGVNWIEADLEFIETARQTGNLGKFYSNLVNMRGKKNASLRGAQTNKTTSRTSQNKTVNKNSPARNNVPNKSKQAKQNQGVINTQATRRVNAPAAIGTQMAGTRSAQSDTNLRVRTTDTFGLLTDPSGGLSLDYLIKLNPCYWPTSSLSMYVSYYDEYRFNSIIFEYIPAVGTSTAGEVFLVIVEDPTANMYSNAASGISQMMSSPESRMTPCWQGTSLVFKPSDQDFRKTNPLRVESLREAIYGDFGVYSSSTAVNVGYIRTHVDVSFRHKRATSISAALASIYYPNSSASLTDRLAANAASDVVQLFINPTFFAATGTLSWGTVFEIIIDASQGTVPNNWAYVTGSVASSISISNGDKLYLSLSNQSGGQWTCNAYADYASAQVRSNALVYKIATTAQSTFYAYINTVRASPLLNLLSN